MDQVLEECHDALNVSGISHDAAITPQQMTECCQRLLDYKHVINPLFHETKLIVSTFYTVMKDGEITIPWNWENEQWELPPQYEYRFKPVLLFLFFWAFQLKENVLPHIIVKIKYV